MITQSQRFVEQEERPAPWSFAGPKIGLMLAGVASILGVLGALTSDGDDVGGYGLIGVMSPLYWFGLVIAAVATAVLLWTTAEVGSRYAVAVPFVWLILLHTAPQLVHDHVRSPDAWSNLGLVRMFSEAQGADLAADPRFVWPGFFGAAAAPMAGLDPGVADVVLRLWPSAITGSVAVLVIALARRSYPTLPLVGCLSAFVYVLLAWTGHDQFSPRSVGLLLFVALLAVLESGPLRTGTAWSASAPLLPRFAVSGGDRPVSLLTAPFVTLVLLGLGTIVVHPIAVLMVLLALLVMGLYGRSVAWRLLLLLGVGAVLWMVVVAEPWFTDGLSSAADLAGDGFESVDGDPAPNSSPSAQYLLVTRVRLILTIGVVAAVLGTAVAMGRDGLRQLKPAVPLVPLVATGLVVYAFGGIDGATTSEILTFTLPVASVLIGRLLAGLRIRTTTVVATAAAAALAPLLLLARFGDDAFVRTTAADRAAIETAYAQADGDTLFVADSRYISWRDQGVADNTFAVIPVSADDEWLSAVRNRASGAGRSRIVVLLTDSQKAWRIHGRNDAATTLDEFAAWLTNEPDAALLYNDGSAWAIELRP